MGRAGGWSAGCGLVLSGWLVVFSCLTSAGCTSSAGSASQADAKERIWQLFRVYKAYVERNKKGPPDEQSLREFGARLSPQERDEAMIGDDLEGIFTSPRDGQKYVVRYNLKLEPTGPTKGVIWEAQGEGGYRFVALTMGYVEEYNETMFKEYTK